MYIMFLIYVTFDAHDIAKEWEREGKELWITSLTDTTKDSGFIFSKGSLIWILEKAWLG